MNSQTEKNKDQKDQKNKVFKPDEFKKNSEQKNLEKENEDPEHEYIAGEKEGDFPPDIKMNDTAEKTQQKPSASQSTNKEGQL